MRTAGGQLTVITGSSFGPVGAGNVDWVRYASLTSSLKFEATACEVTVAHRELACVTAPGVGTDFVWQVSVAGQPSASAVTSYMAPAITSITVGAGGLMNTTGGDRVAIVGHNLGSAGFLTGVTYATAGGETQLAAGNCSFRVPHHELVCVTAPGVGTGYYFSVDVGGQTALAEVPFSYRPPVVTGVHPLSVPAAGGATVVITGRHFGTNVLAIQVVAQGSGVVLAGTAGALSLEHGDTHLSFQSPALASQHTQFVVVVAGQASDTFTLVATPPLVFATQLEVSRPPGAPSNSSDETALVVLGENFGSAQHTIVRLVPYTVAVDSATPGGDISVTQVDNSTRVECDVVSVSASRIACYTRYVSGVLQADVFGRLLEVPFDMREMVRKPVLNSVSPAAVPTTGGLVTLTGSSMRSQGIVWMQQYAIDAAGVPTVVPDSTKQCAVQSWSDTVVTCMVPPGQGRGYRFVVLAAWVTGVPSADFRCVCLWLRRVCGT